MLNLQDVLIGTQALCQPRVWFLPSYGSQNTLRS